MQEFSKCHKSDISTLSVFRCVNDVKIHIINSVENYSYFHFAICISLFGLDHFLY